MHTAPIVMYVHSTFYYYNLTKITNLHTHACPDICIDELTNLVYVYIPSQQYS